MERVSYHRLARRELNEAAQYYESESPGLGVAFLDEVERCTQAIVNFPEAELVSFTYWVRISMSCSAVSVCKVDRLGKCAIVSEIDRAVVSRKRGSMKQIGQQSAVVRVPSAGGLICLLDGRMGLPGGEVELIVQKDFQP